MLYLGVLDSEAHSPAYSSTLTLNRKPHSLTALSQRSAPSPPRARPTDCPGVFLLHASLKFPSLLVSSILSSAPAQTGMKCLRGRSIVLATCVTLFRSSSRDPFWIIRIYRWWLLIFISFSRFRAHFQIKVFKFVSRCVREGKE